MKRGEGRRRVCGPGVGLAAFLIVAAPSAAADIGRPQDSGATTVRTGLFVLDIDDIDGSEQNFTANVYFELRWRDSRLAHGGTGEVSHALNEVWHPRVEIINQQRLWLTFPDFVEVSPEGEVVYRQRVWGQFSQPLDLEDFPFDTQSFRIQLAAVGYSPDEVEFVADPQMPSGLAEKLSLADWRMLNWHAAGGPYAPAPHQNLLAGYVFAFEAARKQGFFVIKVIIPLVLIVAMSWVVFWIDPQDTGSQIGVSVTAMLTLIAYRFALSTHLPNISYLTRLDFFILASTVVVFASLVEVVVTSHLARTGRLATARRVDRSMRIVFPGAFAAVLLRAFVY